MGQINQVVVFNDLYKTKYTNPEELARVDDGVLPLKTHKTSWLSAEDQSWLTSAIGTPAHFMCPAGGFGAGCLVRCEMTGVAGFSVTVIADSHYVTVESMSALKPVLTKVALPDDGVDEIFCKPLFR